MNPQQPQQPFFGPPPPPTPTQPPQLPPVDPNDRSQPLQQYDFIMSDAKPGKAPKLSGPVDGSSKVKRIAIAGGGAFVLLIFVLIVSSILTKKPDTTTPLLAVAQEQTELARVAADGQQHAASETTQNLAGNVELTMTSASGQMTGYLSSNGLKIKPIVLTAKHSKLADANLANALANSTYDSTFTTLIQNDLGVYTGLLKSALNITTGPKGRAILQAQYDQAQLLIAQSNQPID